MFGGRCLEGDALPCSRPLAAPFGPSSMCFLATAQCLGCKRLHLRRECAVPRNVLRASRLRLQVTRWQAGRLPYGEFSAALRHFKTSRRGAGTQRGSGRRKFCPRMGRMGANAWRADLRVGPSFRRKCPVPRNVARGHACGCQSLDGRRDACPTRNSRRPCAISRPPAEAPGRRGEAEGGNFARE